ncbi:MAG: PSD1 and planctomycete cytochrome C domain-containing protein [Verrucomicrobiota bacterium]
MSKLFFPWLVAPFALSAVAEERVDFNRDIRPILTKECTACHGGVKAAGNLSFIDQGKALGIAKSGERPIVPGDAAASEMVKRMRSKDADEVMPQPKHGPALPEAQIRLIERWISQGAEWQEHWAFRLPQEPDRPVVTDETWPSVELDRFILKRLELENLKPSPEAAPAEWLRRVSFDLTGLPPSPEELTAYQKAFGEDAAAARGAVVDRLLASPHFGERWAAVWLDLARYSDTYGFEKDPNRTIWPYRDWVIRAFNKDLPYDDFVVAQLAGDLLPEASAEQRLATAFHRNTQTNTEGGTDDEEFRLAAVIDRVSTTWTAFQATTFGCVQCHAHPYDPIEHDEFYQFLAFFNSTTDSDLDDDSPRMKIAEDPAQSKEASALELKLAILREQLNAPGHHLAVAADWTPFTPDSFTPQHGTLALSADGTVRSSGTLPVGTVHRVTGPATDFTALRLRILPESDDAKLWPERGSFVSRLEVKLVDAAGKSTAVPMKEVFVDRFGDLKEAGPGGNVGGYPKLEGPRWFVFVPKSPVTASPGSRIEVSLKQSGETGGHQATPVRRFAIDLSNEVAWTTLVNDEERVSAWKSRGDLAKRYAEIQGTMVPVMVERPPRETRVFSRGNRMTKDKIVSTGVPKVLGGAAKESMTRLDMARWIASEENPLTARVMVNRLWGELFGLGLVETMEDFGTSGTPPIHPELLDHLALRFQGDFKWSIKAMLRELVVSSTYRQTHHAAADLVEKDSDNRLLARGPRNRLSAEMIRDQSLAVAGLLSPKMFGPSVYPPQPAGVWSTVYNGAKWKESTGEDRYRRAVYTYSKRTSGYPGFLTFDAPSRDLCSARRLVSNTPLQALVTLNDPAHIEASRAMAGRMAAHSPDLREQLAFGVLLATQQLASAEMLDELAALLADATADYQATPAESAKLGETPAAAALVLVANTLLNLDSALTR